MDIAKNLKDKERLGARVVVIEEGSEPEEFWKIVGGKPTGVITSAEAAGDDLEAEQKIGQYITLHKFNYC